MPEAVRVKQSLADLEKLSRRPGYMEKVYQ